MQFKTYEEALVARWRVEPDPDVPLTRRSAIIAQATCLRRFLRGRVVARALDTTSLRFQRDVMKWIFRNEDRVWRERGGRPGEETVEMFLEFVSPQRKCYVFDASATNGTGTGELHAGHEAFPGLILLSEAFVSESDPVEIIGYAIGTVSDVDTYEVVTAWTSPHYRGLNLALAVRCLALLPSRFSHSPTAVLQNSIRIRCKGQELQVHYLRYDFGWVQFNYSSLQIIANSGYIGFDAFRSEAKARFIHC